MREVGWTKAEYDQCPELASRLHKRILDLQDALGTCWGEAYLGCLEGEDSDKACNLVIRECMRVLGPYELLGYREGEKRKVAAPDSPQPDAAPER